MIASEKVYLKGINGLRAIAAISVVISHTLSPIFGDFGLKTNFNLPLAQFGVTLFFVISGFLITYLLLLEKKSIKSIKIKKFYVRRALRIWPIYYLVILIVVLLSFCFGIDFKGVLTTKIYWYIFFTSNVPFIVYKGIPIIVHFWSIGVEEQFYLFWPWILKFTTKGVLFVSFILFIIIFLVKISSWIFLSNQSLLYRSISVTRFHCMLIGAIGAIYYFNANTSFIRVFSNKLVQWFSWILFILIGIGLYLPAPIAHEVFAIISLSLLIGQIALSEKIINLENSFFNFLGMISYGVYVYHVLIIYLLAKILKNFIIGPEFKCLFICISVLFTTIIISYISYEYIERKFLKFKIKYSVISSKMQPE